MCYLPSVSVNRWLQVRLEGIGAAIIFLVALLALSALITTVVDAGLVGLVLSYALNTTSSLNWVIRSASEVEQNIVSVERIMHQIEVSRQGREEVTVYSLGDRFLPRRPTRSRRISLRTGRRRARSSSDITRRGIVRSWIWS